MPYHLSSNSSIFLCSKIDVNMKTNATENQIESFSKSNLSSTPEKSAKIIETLKGQKIVNLSEKILDSYEISVLSRGLKFCPTQTKNDPGEGKREIEEFHRKIRTKEFFSKIPSNHFNVPVDSYDQTNRPTKEDIEKLECPFPFDKTEKFAKLKTKSNWNPPKGSANLETFITMNEIAIQKNNPPKPRYQNITPMERESLKKLSRNNEIRITPADKGGAIVILNMRDYINEGIKQLSDTNTYQALEKDITSEHNEEIASKVQEMVRIGDISEKMGKTLHNPNPRLASIYFLPKIHKSLENPPGRPIVSANGCPTERISAFVDHFLNPLVKEAKLYVKDTTYFLQKIEELPSLNKNSIIGSLDVTSLYTKIPNEEGIQACRRYLQQSRNQWMKPSTQSILDLLRLVLNKNSFQFNNKHYLQVGGVSMGTKTAPSFANLFMRDLEEKLIDNHPKKPRLWLRYVDDIFIIWDHGEEALIDWVNYLNNTHASIKFTLEYSEKSINFLDTKVIKDEKNKLYTDLYCKQTDTNSYLDHKSAHPPHCKRALPYSQFLRIKRICTKKEDYEKHAKRKIGEFQQKGYPHKLLRESKSKVDEINREELFKKKEKSEKELGTFLTTTFRPGNHTVTKTVKGNWDTLARSTTTRKMHENGLKIGYKRPKNLRDILMKAKVNYNPDGNKEESRRKKCKRKNCKYCKMLNKSLNLQHKKRDYQCKTNISCESSNLIYCLECTRCNKKYIGETKRELRTRIREHLNKIDNKDDATVYHHYHSGECCKEDIEVRVLDFIFDHPESKRSNSLRKIIENNWIQRLETYAPNGLNIMDSRFG